MKKNPNFGNSLFLLVTPLVTTLSLGILSSNAATLAASEMAGNINENVELHHEFVIAANSANTDISDRQKLLLKNLLSNTGDNIGNSHAINSIQSSSEEPLKIILNSFQSLEESKALQNQHPIESSTQRVQPAEIDPTPTSEERVVKALSQNNTPKAPTNTSGQSSEPLTSQTGQKLALLPKAVSVDKELFDPLQIIGGALALGFFFWMLISD